MKNIDYYAEFSQHLNEPLFGDWFKISRSSKIGAETCEIKHVPENDVITAVILPSSMERYTTDGIKLNDLVLLWVNDNVFIPTTFEWYNDLYKKGMEETQGEKIGNWMYEHIMEFIENTCRTCGVAV